MNPSGPELLWGMAWRCVAWHVGIGAGLGGLYGCAFVAAALMTPSAGEEGWVWLVRLVVVGGGVAGCVAGWVVGRLPGAVVGVLAGTAAGGMPFLFYYLFAFPSGAVFGAAYGLAVGVTNAVVVSLIVRSRPTPGTLGRVLAPAGALGVLVLPLPWLPDLGSGPPVEIVSSGLTGSPVADFFVMAIFPMLLLAPFASCVGRRLGNWYAGAADGGVRDVGST